MIPRPGQSTPQGKSPSAKTRNCLFTAGTDKSGSAIPSDAILSRPKANRRHGGYSDMKTLLITRIKPNPAGKDRNRFGTATASQLGAEWVNFKNTGSAAVDLCGIELYHLAYAPGSTQGRWDKIIDFNGILQVGRTVRGHSGSGPESVIRPEDRAGADHHLFTGRNYVWNNRE